MIPVSPRCPLLQSPGSGQGAEGCGGVLCVWYISASCRWARPLAMSLKDSAGSSSGWGSPGLLGDCLSCKGSWHTAIWEKGGSWGVPDSISQSLGGCGPPRLPGARGSASDQIPQLPRAASLSSSPSVTGGAWGWAEGRLGSGLEHCHLLMSPFTPLALGSSFINGDNDSCLPAPPPHRRLCTQVFDGNKG